MKSTKQRKLIISVFIALVLFIGILLLIPNVKTAKAEKLESYDNFNFTQITNDDGEAAYKIGIKPAYRSTVEFVVIPETYEGLPITEIAANGFMSCTKLTKVILPTTVRVLGNNAFMNCTKLKSIVLPNVQRIGNNAFATCTSLDRLFIPNSVTAVGSTILRNNPNTVYIQSSTEVVNTLWSSTWSNYFTGEIVSEAGLEDAIHYREILATDNQTVIGYEIAEEQLFGSCDSDLIIYNSICLDENLGYLPVLNICSDAFFGFSANSITITERPEDDTVPSFTHKINIRSNAFEAAFVNEIKIETGVTFNHPENLQLVNAESLYDGQPIVGDSDGFSTKLFRESTIKSITLPSDIDYIMEKMFYECTFLENIKIGDSSENLANVLSNVTRIGTKAFYCCTSLKEITIPSSVTYIGEAAFSNLGENIEKQIINVDFYEDEIPQGWDSNWAVDNKENVKISYKPLTYLTVNLYEDKTISVGVKPGRLVPDLKDEIVRDGYIFNGIYSSEEDGGFQYYNGRGKGARAWNVGDPVNLYASWKLAEYSIDYENLLNGTNHPLNPVKYTIESDTITFVEPTGRNGYDGTWDILSIPKGSSGNKVITAVWTPIEYTITYKNLLDGTNPSTNPEKYTIESETINFANPTGREGYNGTWDITSIENGSTGNIVITAVWEPIEYTITYDVDLKGLTNPNPTTYTVEDEITFVKLEKAGYIFEWNPMKIEKGTIGNQTVIGNWTAIEYTITYKVDLKGLSNPNPTTYTVEDEITFINLEKAGYTFEWDPIKIDEGTIGNQTVIGNWTAIEYTITYDVDLKGQTNPNPTTYTVEDEIIFINLAKAGYTFEWNPAKISKGTIGNLTVYGNWELIHYIITYVPNFIGLSNPKTYTVEDEITFIKPEKAGYMFEWNPIGISKGTTGDITVNGCWELILYNITYIGDFKGHSNPNPTKYTIEDEITFTKLVEPGYMFNWDPIGISKGTTGDITVSAKWEKLDYPINYIVDLKGLTNPNPTRYDVDTEYTFIKLELPGYIFEWSPAKIDKGTIGNLTVVGKWTAIEYAISYNVDLKGQTNPNPTKYTVENEVAFKKLEKAGYTFEWSPAKINQGTIGNVTVKGTWTPINYSINYVVWDGTYNPNPTTYNVEKNITFSPATYDGYTVTWDKLSTNGCTGNLTVTAIYTDILASCYNSARSRFEIYTAADLDLLRSARTENKTYYVEVNYNNNEWKPIKEFKGTLTGSVTGIRLYPKADSEYYGFIITNRGTINDFALDGTLVVNNTLENINYRFVGLLCGINFGKIIGCNVSSSSPISRRMINGEYGNFDIVNTVDPFVWIGGLVGNNCNIIKNCNNYLNIYADCNIGGIACDSSGKITGTNNYGTIRYCNSGTFAKRIGGIVCIATDEIISECHNYGDIWYMSNAVEPSLDFQPSIGMIAGELDALSWAALENCSNSGTLHTGNLYAKQLDRVGGLIGYIWDED